MPMNDPSGEQQTRRGTAVYQGALEAVLAIGVAAGIGAWIDHRWGTSPRGLITGTIVGFGSFVLRLWRMRELFQGDEPPGGPGKRH